MGDIMDIDFYMPVESTHTCKPSPASQEKSVRLYCTAAHGPGPMSRWLLQVRTPIHRADGSVGKAFVAAGASLYPEDLRRLRDAATAALDAYDATFGTPKPTTSKDRYLEAALDAVEKVFGEGVSREAITEAITAALDGVE